MGGLEGAGTHTGSVRLSDSGGATLDVPYTVLVREPRRWAAVLIFAGVASASVVGFVSGAVLSWARRRGQAKVLVNQIDDVLSRHEPVASSIDRAGRWMIFRLRDEVINVKRTPFSRDQGKRADLRITITERHLRLLDLLCVAWRVLASVPPNDPSVNPSVTSALKLLDDGADNSKDEDDVASGLLAIVSDARARSTIDDIRRIRAAVAAIEPPLEAALLTTVAGLLTQAEESTDSGEVQAKVATAEALAADALLKRTEGLATATGLSAVTAAFRTAKDALPPGRPRTLEDVRTIQQAVVDALTSKLHDVVAAYEGEEYKDQPIRAEAAIQRERLSVAAAARATDPAASLASLAMVSEWAARHTADLGVVGDLLSVLHILPRPDPVAMLVDGVDPPPRSREELGGTVLAWWTLQAILWLLVGIVTVLLGLYSLYESKATWGGAGDHVLAVLWGAGLSGGSVATMVGATGARKALGLGGAGVT